MVQEVYHPIELWNINEANQFIASHLWLYVQQYVQLNSDLKAENFLEEYDNLPQF